MNLLYISIKALLNPDLDCRLVRCVFELRTMTEQGMMPGLFSCVECGRSLMEESDLFFSQEAHGLLGSCCAGKYYDAKRISPAACQAMRYVVSAPMGRLFAFTVKEEVLRELEHLVYTYTAANTDRRFRSLQILEVMC